MAALERHDQVVHEPEHAVLVVARELDAQESPLLPVQPQLVDERRHSFGLVELGQRVRGSGHVDAP